MSYDTNKCTFSGKVENFKRISTKTGTPMISFKLKCWKEKIRVVAFKELAESTTLNDGDRIEIVGRLQSSSWEYEGAKFHGFQIIADEIQPCQEKRRPRNPARRTEFPPDRDEIPLPCDGPF